MPILFSARVGNREFPFCELGQEYRMELQPLGFMYSHDLNCICVGSLRLEAVMPVLISGLRGKELQYP